jgi:outer membrane protein
MKIFKNIAISILAIAVVFGITAFYVNGKSTKTAYVNLSSVYEKFEMKNELQKQLENVQQKRTFILDSLGLILKTQAALIKEQVTVEKQSDYEIQSRQYISLKQQYEQDNVNVAQNYQEQIWKQINQYVNDYGEQNGYAYIFGADGSGSVMYASKNFDITDDLTKYVNQRYKGLKK